MNFRELGNRRFAARREKFDTVRARRKGAQYRGFPVLMPPQYFKGVCVKP